MISFAYLDGSLMKALGRIGNVIKQQDIYLDTQEAALADPTTGVTAQLEAEPDVQAVTGANYVSSLEGQNLGPLCQSQAEAVINRFVFRDNPRVNQTLTQFATLSSLQEIIRQMAQQGQTVKRADVSVNDTTLVTGNGQAAMLVSVKRPIDGALLENCFDENLNAVCVADSFTGGATIYQEAYRVAGKGRETNVFGFDWPAGSGSQVQLTAIDGESDVSGGNLLTNSGFDSWEDNVPTGWELVTGTAGVSIIKDTGIVLRPGGSSIRFVGDGVTNVRLRREVTGLLPLTQYGLCAWAQRDGVVASQGLLRLALTDADGTVLLSAAGDPCQVEITLSSLPTLYEVHGASVRTPRVMPDEVYIDIQLTTPLENGRAVYLDVASLGNMTQMYVGGPFVSFHSGGEAGVLNDSGTVHVQNLRDGTGSLSTWQTLFYRLFPDFQNSELMLPSSPTPSIPDAWIA